MFRMTNAMKYAGTIWTSDRKSWGNSKLPMDVTCHIQVNSETYSQVMDMTPDKYNGHMTEKFVIGHVQPHG